MNVYFKVDTTGIDNEQIGDTGHEVIRWHAVVTDLPSKEKDSADIEDKLTKIAGAFPVIRLRGFGASYVQDDKESISLVAGNLYHPEFKRDWDKVAEHNGITSAMVAKCPSNTQLKEDIPNFFEALRDAFPDEPVNIVMYDAKFVHEMLSKTGYQFNMEDNENSIVRVVDVKGPVSCLEAYRKGEEWKINPSFVSLDNAYQQTFLEKGETPIPLNTKKSPLDALIALRVVHNKMKDVINIKHDFDDVVFKNINGKPVMYQTLVADPRMSFSPCVIPSLYSEKHMAKYPTTSKGQALWSKSLKQLQDDYLKADSDFSLRIEKEEIRKISSSLPFSVESCKEVSDGFQVTVCDETRQANVFVGREKLNKADSIYLPAATLGTFDFSSEQLPARLALAISLDKDSNDIFKNKNNALVLSEAGLYCLKRAMSDEKGVEHINIDEISKALDKPWQEVERDLARDIRAEGLQGYITLPMDKRDGNMITIASHGLSEQFFVPRWEEEKKVEKVMTEQKENAERPLVMRNCNLQGMDLSSMDLSHAVLEGSDLRGANLSDTNLSHANLIGVIMDKDTKLTNTNFEKAIVVGMESSGVDFHNAKNMNTVITSAKRLGIKLGKSAGREDNGLSV